MKIPEEPKVSSIGDVVVNPQLMYFLGAMRDGTLPKVYDNHYEISVAQKNIDWLTEIIKPILTDTLKIQEEKIRLKIDKNTPRLVIYSKKHYTMLSNLGLKSGVYETPAIVLSQPLLQKWYIRGFFDAEGEVPHVEKFLDKTVKTFPRLRIRIHQAWSNKKHCPPLEDIKKILENTGIKCNNIWGPKLNKNTYDFDLPISGKEVLNFYDKIGSSHSWKIMCFNLLFNLYNKNARY